MAELSEAAVHMPGLLGNELDQDLSYLCQGIPGSEAAKWTIDSDVSCWCGAEGVLVIVWSNTRPVPTLQKHKARNEPPSRKLSTSLVTSLVFFSFTRLVIRLVIRLVSNHKADNEPRYEVVSCLRISYYEGLVMTGENTRLVTRLVNNLQDGGS